jgi:ribosome-binding protein aMBF1 (putative translation factor)
MVVEPNRTASVRAGIIFAPPPATQGRLFENPRITSGFLEGGDMVRATKKAGTAEQKSEQILRGIAANIRARRQQVGMSQAKLAEALKVSQAFINHLESGRKNVNIRNVCKLAEALGTTAEALMMSGSFGAAEVHHRRKVS